MARRKNRRANQRRRHRARRSGIFDGYRLSIVARIAALALAGALVSHPVAAHTASPGMEGLGRGFVHPLTFPALLLATLAIGLLMGQRLQFYRQTWAIFMAGNLAGLALAWAGWLSFELDVPLYLLALIAGLLVAAAVPLPLAAARAAMAVAGLLTGAVALPDWGPVGAMIATAAGALAGAWAIVFYVSEGAGFLSSRFKQAWLAIGVRIIGSWLAAIAIFLIALAVRTGNAIL